MLSTVIYSETGLYRIVRKSPNGDIDEIDISFNHKRDMNISSSKKPEQYNNLCMPQRRFYAVPL